MNWLSLLHHRRTDLTLRLILGGIFIYAGVVKTLSPLTFADQIAAYRLLPNLLINHVTLGLPIFEILCGLLLLINWKRRLALHAILLLTVVFAVFLLSAIARGLHIDCGCFGSSIIPLRFQLWFSLLRDMGLFALTWLLFLNAPAGSFISTSAKQPTPS